MEPEEEALQLVARQATGGMRDAISLLDQLSATGKKISLETAQTILGTATNQAVLDLVDAILTGDAGGGLNKLHTTLDNGSDPRQFSRQIVNYLRKVMLVRLGNADQVDTTAETRQVMAKHANGFESSEILRIIRVFNHAAVDARGSWQPSLPLELAFVEAIEAPVQLSSNPAKKAPQAVSKPASEPVKQAVNKAVKEQENSPEASVEVQESSQMTREQWAGLLEVVKKPSPNTRGLLNSCKTNTLRNGVLLLGFPSQLLKEKMEQPEHLSVVKDAAEKIFEMPIQIECAIVASGQGALPPQVDNSGMVATGVRLGGEIVDVNNLKTKDKDSE